MTTEKPGPKLNPALRKSLRAARDSGIPREGRAAMVKRYQADQRLSHVLPEGTVFENMTRQGVATVLETFAGSGTTADDLAPVHLRRLGELLYAFGTRRERPASARELDGREIKLVSTLIRLCEDTLHTGRYVVLAETQPATLAQAAFVVNAVAKLKSNPKYRSDLADFDQARLSQLVERVDSFAAHYFSVEYSQHARARHLHDDLLDQAVEARSTDQDQDDGWYDDDDGPESDRQATVKLSVNERTEHSVRIAHDQYESSVGNIRARLLRSGSISGSADPLYLLKNAMIAADLLQHAQGSDMTEIISEAGERGERLYDFSKHRFVDPTFAHLDIHHADDKGLVMHVSPRPLLFSAVMSEYQHDIQRP